MKKSKKFLLSLAAPCLIVVSLFGFFYRKDNDRVQAIPAFFVGIGLILSGSIGRTKRRGKLLNEMLNRRNALN